LNNSTSSVHNIKKQCCVYCQASKIDEQCTTCKMRICLKCREKHTIEHCCSKQIDKYLDVESCFNCERKLKEKRKMCNDCKRTTYCSKKCQREDWLYHKVVCKESQKQENQGKQTVQYINNDKISIYSIQK